MNYWQIAAPIWLCLVFYLVAVVCSLLGRRFDSWGQRLWTLACLAYLLHVAAAFHYFLSWSHRQAFDHTERGSGFGPGIYITYAFTAFWVMDVACRWILPVAYRRQPYWLRVAWQGFAAFMLFNGSVVFAEGFSRILGSVVFAVLALVLMVRTSNRGRQRAQGG